MASSGEDVVEDALNVLLNVTEKSGNLRSDLRKDILKARYRWAWIATVEETRR